MAQEAKIEKYLCGRVKMLGGEVRKVKWMTDACAIGKDTVEISVDDLRIFMQIGKLLV